MTADVCPVPPYRVNAMLTASAMLKAVNSLVLFIAAAARLTDTLRHNCEAKILNIRHRSASSLCR
jgi:hypothetical protein